MNVFLSSFRTGGSSMVKAIEYFELGPSGQILILEIKGHFLQKFHGCSKEFYWKDLLKGPQSRILHVKARSSARAPA